MLRNVVVSVIIAVVGLALLVGMIGGGVWYITRPTRYDFGNDTRLVVPSGVISIDRRKDGYGIVVQSGVNVTVSNDSDEWRTLTVSFRKPNRGILDTHAFEDLPPKSSKTFGADSVRYAGMHISVSDLAQKKRDKGAKTNI